MSLLPYEIAPPRISPKMSGINVETQRADLDAPVRTTRVSEVPDEAYPWFRIDPKTAGPRQLEERQALIRKQEAEVEEYVVRHLGYWRFVNAETLYTQQEVDETVESEYRKTDKQTLLDDFSWKVGLSIDGSMPLTPAGPAAGAAPAAGPVAAASAAAAKIGAKFDSEVKQQLKLETIAENVVAGKSRINTKRRLEPGFYSAWVRVHQFIMYRRRRGSTELEPVKAGGWTVEDPNLVWVRGEEASLTKLGGDDQTAAKGSVFAAPLRLKATDGAGRPLSGVEISFSVETGQAEVIPPMAQADGNGEAKAMVIAGRQEGALVVAASYGSVAQRFVLQVKSVNELTTEAKP